jgi:hypothetical protein
MRAVDVSCMVLPGSFSFTRASRALRAALWSSRRPIVVHRTPATNKAFAGRSVQAAVLVVGPERKRRPPLRLARVDVREGSVNVLEAWSLSRAQEEPDNWFIATPADERSGEHLTLGDIATVRRGTATGANDVFFLTAAEAAAFPEDVVIPALVSLRGFAEEEFDLAAHARQPPATRRWLLAIPPTYLLTGALKDYVERHKPAVGNRYLPSQRNPWYSIRELTRPQLLISPLSKAAFKVVVNTAEVVPSNNLFGISLKNGGDPRVLAGWLRSDAGQTELRRLSRRYPGGSHKLEPGALSATRLPSHFA